jgi:hypothetical protein
MDQPLAELSARARAVAADFMATFGWNRHDLENAVGLLKRRAGSTRKPVASNQFFYSGSCCVSPAPSASNCGMLPWPLRAKKWKWRLKDAHTSSSDLKSAEIAGASTSERSLSILAARSISVLPSRSELIKWMVLDMETCVVHPVLRAFVTEFARCP